MKLFKVVKTKQKQNVECSDRVCGGPLTGGAATAALQVNTCQDSPLAVQMARTARWCVSHRERTRRSLLLREFELNKHCCSLLPCGGNMSWCRISGRWPPVHGDALAVVMGGRAGRYSAVGCCVSVA